MFRIPCDHNHGITYSVTPYSVLSAFCPYSVTAVFRDCCLYRILYFFSDARGGTTTRMADLAHCCSAQTDDDVPDWPYVLELVVDEHLRGMGVGGALLDALIERVRGVKHLVRLSLAVFADNAPALGLYRSRGFVEEGRRRSVVLDEDGTFRDDVLMVMRIDHL